MTVEIHKTIVVRFFQEGLKNGQTDIFEEILTPNCTYTPEGKLMCSNRDEFTAYVIEALEPYIKREITIDSIFAEDDNVAVRCTYYFDTNEAQYVMKVMGFFEFSEGKIVKIWRNAVTANG